MLYGVCYKPWFSILKCLGVLVESRMVICFIMPPHLAQMTRRYPSSQPLITCCGITTMVVVLLISLLYLMNHYHVTFSDSTVDFGYVMIIL